MALRGVGLAAQLYQAPPTNPAPGVFGGGGGLTSFGEYDMFVAKLNGSDRSEQWARAFGGSFDVRAPYTLACDPAGDIHVGGDFSGTLGMDGTLLSSSAHLGGLERRLRQPYRPLNLRRSTRRLLAQSRWTYRREGADASRFAGATTACGQPRPARTNLPGRLPVSASSRSITSPPTMVA